MNALPVIATRQAGVVPAIVGSTARPVKVAPLNTLVHEGLPERKLTAPEQGRYFRGGPGAATAT